MKVSSLCQQNVTTIRGDANVVEAAKIMREHHVGDVIVTGNGLGREVPLGIVTDRDLVVGVLAREVDDPHTIKISDIMGRKLHTCEMHEDLVDVRKRMWSNAVRRMPVVDKEGTLVGVIAYDDLVRWLAEELADLTRVMPRQQRREHETRR